MNTNELFRHCDFIVLAQNRQDPNPQTPIEAWAYRGPLNFQKSAPVTFGQGADVDDALRALESQLVKATDKINTESFGILLQEQSSDEPARTITVKLLSEAGKLWIRPDGYGDKTSQDGCGYPIGLEIWEGRLRLIIFDDINREDPKIIDLEKARESGRIAEGDCREQDVNGKSSGANPSLIFSVDERQLATLLAALRFYQDENLQAGSAIPDKCIAEIASNCGQLAPLDFDEVDALCKKLNHNKSVGLTVAPPPEEADPLPIYRVVYVIDVNAADAHEAADEAHKLMRDPQSWPPVLETMDHRGHLLRIDLCQSDKHLQKPHTKGKKS